MKSAHLTESFEQCMLYTASRSLMKTTSKRTQIYLPSSLHEQAAAYARRHNLSLAAVIRISLQDRLRRAPGLSKKAYDTDPIWTLVGAARSKGKPTDVSVYHDHYLYGRSKASYP